MRLIDADKLIEELTIKAVSKDAHIISIANAVVNFVNNQPTAYSVDEVVEGLEERKALHERLVDYETKNGTVTEKYQNIKAIDVLNKAIEIVKQGGVSDYVCEWKYVTAYTYYKVGCKENIVPTRYGDYCPYCGKKIKVVE